MQEVSSRASWRSCLRECTWAANRPRQWRRRVRTGQNLIELSVPDSRGRLLAAASCLWSGAKPCRPADSRALPTPRRWSDSSGWCSGRRQLRHPIATQRRPSPGEKQSVIAITRSAAKVQRDWRHLRSQNLGTRGKPWRHRKAAGLDLWQRAMNNLRKLDLSAGY